jgi:hypothetical protein
MGVGGIRGGGRSGGPKGPRGAGAAAGPKGKGFGPKVDATSSLVGASGLVGSDNVGRVVVEKAAEIARALRAGEIATKSEAARRLVAQILRERIHMQSKALEARIAEQIEDDPRLAQSLEKIWAEGAKG